MKDRTTKFLLAIIGIALWGFLLRPLFTVKEAQAEGQHLIIPQAISPQVQVLSVIDKKIVMTYVTKGPDGLTRIIRVIGLDEKNQLVQYDAKPYK